MKKMLLFIWSPLGDSCPRLLNVTHCFLNPSERRSSEPARCPVEVCWAGSPRSASEMQVKWTLWVITIIIILDGGPAPVDSCHLGSNVISLKVFPVHSVWSCPLLPLQLQYRLSWSFSCVKLMALRNTVAHFISALVRFLSHPPLRAVGDVRLRTVGASLAGPCCSPTLITASARGACRKDTCQVVEGWVPPRCLL